MAAVLCLSLGADGDSGFSLQMLCRMRDSTQLLQKKLIQEADEEQRDGVQASLHQYKVHQPQGHIEPPEGSKAVLMNRFMLQEFLRWLCVSLLDSLYPGASFSKCLMSLHLLGLLGQFFTFSTGKCPCYLPNPKSLQRIFLCLTFKSPFIHLWIVY